jgi:membrane fusion protein (multidrug efflux system)
MLNEPSQKPLRKRMIIVIVSLMIFFGAIFGFGLARSILIKRAFAAFTPPPSVISTDVARADNWQPTLTAPGSVVAINGVQVNPEIPGTVVKIYFESGQLVKAGQPLVQLDDSADVQDLKNFQAQLKLANITYQRQSKLYITRSAPAAELDSARASMDETRALMQKTQVLIDKKLIKAPFDGKLGIRQVNLGQYVAAGTALVSLQSMDPLYVQFSLPEQDLKSLSVGQPITLTVEAHGTQQFNGKINAINAQVDTETRNILVQGVVPNPQHLLYPGMYANVVVLLPQKTQVITVPQTAVTYNLFGDSVFIVRQDGTDKQGKPILRAFLTYVTTGDRRDNQVAILTGVKAGDVVVTSGQLKLQDKGTVAINNTTTTNDSKPVTTLH